MCTAVVSLERGAPLLLAGVRDEFADRPWQPPGRHWPAFPGLIGGRDLLAGGTWLAVAPAARRVSCVLNGRGRMAPAESRRSRGVLPLHGAAEGTLARQPLAGFDPFHLLIADPYGVVLSSWDGEDLVERELTEGTHMVVNSGLSDELMTSGGAGAAGADGPGREQELARIGYFLPRFERAARPLPEVGPPAAQAWGEWLPLIDGAGLGPDDPRALIVRREFAGRIWGSTSISLVALWPETLRPETQQPETQRSENGVRYDFTGVPGDPAGWRSC
jgi:hypothetical protein